jgi:spermidine/putrescine transport system ATP-binding protein
MASLSLKQVCRTYEGRAAVKDFTLDVAQGEFIVLLGPSGCGKTTTLRMIAGFVEPTSGSICIDAQDVTRLPPRLRNLGMVFQDYALFPHMNVADNIAFGLRQKKMDSATIKRRVEKLLDLIRLPDKVAAYADELSGGQQQRVALARALAVEPRVLLMDEPLGALDLKLREAMQLELKKLQREFGVTTILVTHDQQEAMTLSDRIVVMRDGEIQQVGTPRALYARPGNQFVAKFIGKNNLMRGRIVGVDANEVLVELGPAAQVAAPTDGTLRSGQLVDLSIRPEQVQLAVPAPAAGLNMLRGVVESRTFLGNLVYYFVRLSADTLVLVEKPAGAMSWEVNDAVGVTCPPEHVTCFAADAGAP